MEAASPHGPSTRNGSRISEDAEGSRRTDAATVVTVEDLAETFRVVASSGVDVCPSGGRRLARYHVRRIARGAERSATAASGSSRYDQVHRAGMVSKAERMRPAKSRARTHRVSPLDGGKRGTRCGTVESSSRTGPRAWDREGNGRPTLPCRLLGTRQPVQSISLAIPMLRPI